MVTDLDGDNQDDVILGSHSPANGISLPDGTDDNHCRLHAFSSNGTLLWMHVLGDTFAGCMPFLVTVTGTKKPRLYSWLTGPHRARAAIGLNEVGSICEHDFSGQRVATNDLGVELVSCLPADLHGDGQPEILATDRLGNLHVLGLDLKRLHTVSVASPAYSMVELHLLAVTNVTGTSERQLVLTSSQVQMIHAENLGNTRLKPNTIFYHDTDVQVWDTSFKPLASLTLEKRAKAMPSRVFHFADLEGDGRQEILVVDREVRVLKYGQRRIWAVGQRPTKAPYKPGRQPLRVNEFKLVRPGLAAASRSANARGRSACRRCRKRGL